jgi:hypothetical protein
VLIEPCGHKVLDSIASSHKIEFVVLWIEEMTRNVFGAAK